MLSRTRSFERPSMALPYRTSAVVFDLDGLLFDSERCPISSSQLRRFALSASLSLAIS